MGIHVGAKSKCTSVNDLENSRAAISRFGSGSHLIAYVNADNYKWDLAKQKFEVVKNLDGGRAYLADGKADYFLWEKFTTKPFVDKGEFRIIGKCPTPWPSFVVAVREELLLTHNTEIEQILKIVNESCSQVKQAIIQLKKLQSAINLKKKM